MTEFQAAGLEFGLRAIGRLFGETGRGVDQRRFSAKHGENLFGVFLPVGRGMQISAGFQA